MNFDGARQFAPTISIRPYIPPPRWMDLKLRSRVLERPAWTREKLVQERAIALSYSVAPSTSSTYDSALMSYVDFCRHGFAIEPTADTFSFFIVYLSSFISPRSIKSYLSGIALKLESEFPSVYDVRKHPIVTRALQGCERMHNKPIITHYCRFVASVCLL